MFRINVENTYELFDKDLILFDKEKINKKKNLILI